jgi:hypothetical protein
MFLLKIVYAATIDSQIKGILFQDIGITSFFRLIEQLQKLQ